MSGEAVAADQRERIFEALVWLVASKGYPAMTLKEVAKVAHVCRETIKLVCGVGSKEACFLWAYDAIVKHAIARVNTAYLAETEWTDKLRCGFAVLIEEVLDRPDAARLALVEAFAAGPAALKRVDGVMHDFEDMVSSTFAASPRHVGLPPLISQGIVGGVSRVVRQRLLEDRVGELPGHADELLDWMLTYHSPASGGLRFGPVPDPTPYRMPERSHEEEERTRLLRAAATVAARHSYQALNAAVIARQAELPTVVFRGQFPGGVEECFLAAYELLGARVSAVAELAARSAGGDWPQRVRAGLYAILWRIAKDRTFARMAFVEVFSAGPAGIACRSMLMRSFSGLLVSQAPPGEAPSELVAEAVVGAVWQLAHQAVWRDAAGRLPAIGEFAAYLVLAPLLGGDDALEAIHA